MYGGGELALRACVLEFWRSGVKLYYGTWTTNSVFVTLLRLGSSFGNLAYSTICIILSELGPSVSAGELLAVWLLTMIEFIFRLTPIWLRGLFYLCFDTDLRWFMLGILKGVAFGVSTRRFLAMLTPVNVKKFIGLCFGEKVVPIGRSFFRIYLVANMETSFYIGGSLALLCLGVRTWSLME